MVRGPFRSLAHVHGLLPAARGTPGDPAGPAGAGTRVVDTLAFESPLGPFGWIVDRLVLASHLHRFPERRAAFLKETAERIGPLCDLLHNRGAPVADRDDAAIGLDAIGHPSALGALVRVACDPTDADIVQWSCGETVAEIWLRTDVVELDILARLVPPARQEAVGLIRERRPEWLAAIDAGHQRSGGA